MNASVYLQSFGWKEGEALQNGGIRKPILVKHKKDTKGLGGDSNDGDVWWERLFDSQLNNLEVNNDSKGVSFSQNNDNVLQDMNKPSKTGLYRMFVKGEGLKGTVGKLDQIISKDKFDKDHTPDIVRKLEEQVDKNIEKIEKKERKEKKEKKIKKEKKKKYDGNKEKRMKDKKEKREKIDKSDKKDKKDIETKQMDKKHKKDKKSKAKADKNVQEDNITNTSKSKSSKRSLEDSTQQINKKKKSI